MTQELLSTSAPAGLHPGTSGFCTVVQSRDLPQPTAELLEALSGYRPVFLPGDPREAENPPALSHVRLNSRGRPVSVLSRVAATDRDYTGRSNRVAHHVVLDGGDARPAAGPGWLATVPGFLERTWDGQVRWLPTGRAVPPGDTPGGCPTWQRLTGDPGWAAVLADAMTKGKPFYLVYDLGMDVAALIAEALSRVPPHLRWDVTFTTYYTGLPSGVRCDVRAVLRGTAEERSAPASARLDVASLRGRPAPAVAAQAVPPPLRTPSRVAAVAAQAPVAAAPEPVAAPAVTQEPPQVEVEDQLRLEFGLKPAKSPRTKGGSGGLALLITMSMVVVAASGIGGWLLFNEGNKPDPHASPKDNGKEPPKDAVAKDGTEKPVPPESGKRALKMALKTRQDKVQIGDDVEFLLELKGEGDKPIDPSAFRNEKVYISPKGTKPDERTPAVAEVKDGVAVWHRFKAKKAGKEEFVAEYDGGEKYDGARATAVIEVEKRLVKLELNLPEKEVYAGQTVKVTASTSNEDFKAWDAVRINKEKGPSVVLPPLKAGETVVTLEKGETAEWRWDEVRKTVTAKVRVLPTLTLTRPNANSVLRGVVELMVEAKVASTPFSAGEVQLFDGDKPLGKRVPLGTKGTADIKVMPDKDKRIEPGDKKQFTVKLFPTDPAKVAAVEATTDPYRVAKFPVAFIKVDVQLEQRAFGKREWVLKPGSRVTGARVELPPPARIIEVSGTGWDSNAGNWQLKLEKHPLVNIKSYMDEIGCLLLSDSITSAMKGNREWVEKTMKPALEATDVYLYEAKPGAKGKKPEKVSDDPVLLIKFVVTVTNAEK